MLSTPGHEHSDSAALSQLLWEAQREGLSPQGGAGSSHEQGCQNSEVWTCFTKDKEIWILDVIYLILNSFMEIFLVFTSLTIA